jgi:ribonuclease T2
MNYSNHPKKPNKNKNFYFLQLSTIPTLNLLKSVNIMIIFAIISLAQSYDYHTLEVTWRPSDCKFSKCTNGYISEDFNIHGLWPDFWNGTYPSYCKKIPFNITEETKKQMKIYWKSFKGGDPSNFWQYEWNKHGTCMNPLLSCDDYFAKTLKLFNDMDIMKKLNDSGILPCNLKKYRIQTIVSAFNKKTIVQCRKLGESYLLTALRICYDLTFNVIDCVESQKKCGNEVFFPSITS